MNIHIPPLLTLIAFPSLDILTAGPVVKLAFERPNIFIGKTIGLTVDRIDINKFVKQMEEVFKKQRWRYEKVCKNPWLID